MSSAARHDTDHNRHCGELPGLIGVEGDLLSNNAIDRIECRATIPREISSRSHRLNASRERRRGEGWRRITAVRSDSWK